MLDERGHEPVLVSKERSLVRHSGLSPMPNNSATMILCPRTSSPACSRCRASDEPRSCQSSVDTIAEAQIGDLSDAEVDVLLEIYEVLRLTPSNGRILRQAGNMYVWDYKGISVAYVRLAPQRRVAVLRVDRFPA
jgi:hypothetical protein